MGVWHMETRKIISFGTSSFVISVPKHWIRENKLKKGDVVHVEDRKDELILTTSRDESKREEKSIYIDIDNKSLSRISTEITSAYLNNYDLVNISGKQLEENASKIKTILRNLSGMEIIKQTSNKITAKDLLNLKEISIRTIIRRMDNIVRSMVLDSIDCFKEDHYESIFDRDSDVNRLGFLAQRTIRAAMINQKLAKHFVMSNNELMFSRGIIDKIEKIGDQTKRIARRIKAADSLTEAEKTKLTALYKKIYVDYTNVMKAYYKKDMPLSYEIEVGTSEISRTCNDYRKKCGRSKKTNDPIDTARIIEYFKNMRISVRNIARAVIGIGEELY